MYVLDLLNEMLFKRYTPMTCLASLATFRICSGIFITVTHFLVHYTHGVVMLCLIALNTNQEERKFSMLHKKKNQIVNNVS
jgi:hypothetical protein